MAQVDGTGLPGRRSLAPFCTFNEAVGGQFSQRLYSLARRGQPSRYIDMRSHPNARRRVVFPNVGEEKEHQQGASLRGHVDTPVQEVALDDLSQIHGLRREAGINVPAGIARIVSGRKPDWKRPEIHAGQPSPGADKLIKRLVQEGRVGGSDKRLLSIHAEPDNRLGPGCWIVLIAAQVPPEDGTGLAGKIAWEC